MRFPLDYIDTSFVTGRSFESDTILASILVSHRNLNRFASVVKVDEFNECAGFGTNDVQFLERTESSTQNFSQLLLGNEFDNPLDETVRVYDSLNLFSEV